MIQLWFKVLHIIAVILFLGNIITGLFWMRIAVRTKNSGIISHSMKSIMQADRPIAICFESFLISNAVF